MAQLKLQESRSATETAVDFMILHVEGRMDERTEAEFVAWCDQDPAHLRLFQNAMISWWDLENQGLQPEIAELRAEALQAYGRANLRRWKAFTPRYRWLTIIVAVTVFGLVAAGWHWLAP